MSSPSSRFLSGLRNCHLPGLNSYVIEPRSSKDSGMHRVFHCVGDPLGGIYTPGGRASYRLAPHNHQYHLSLRAIQGSIANLLWDIHPSNYRDSWSWEYGFSSGVTGEIGVSLIQPVLMAIREVQPVGELPLEMSASEVHTVIASQGAAWEVQEGSLVDHPSLCYARSKDFSLSSEGLYLPMTREELDAAWEVVYGD